MENYGKVPWPKVHDFLLRLESCRSKSEFFQIACAEVGTLIPFDVAVGIFSTFDGRSLHAVGLGDTVDASYNDYYRKRAPGAMLLSGAEQFDLGYFLSVSIIDWRKFQNSEYATDFMLPNRMIKTIVHPRFGHQINLSVHSSRLSPNFSDSDVATLDVLNEHLNNLYRLFDARSHSPGPLLSAEGIADRFGSLSRREAEVCALLVLRLNTAEIATPLFISPRTVEKHIEDIFEKLGVHSRSQLRRKLGG